MTTGWRGPLMHGLVLATTFCVFAWTLASPWGLAAGVLGTLAGCVVAPALHRARVRLPVQVLLALLTAVLGVGTSHWLTDGNAAPAALGPWNTELSSEIPLWSCLALAVAVGLRALALRWRWALVLEGSAVVAAVAATVAAHRDGMIARPLAISDWFWTHGVDPVVAFLALGMAAAVLLANVLAQQRSAGRTAAQMAVVLLLGFLVAQHLHSREADIRARAGGAGKEDDDAKDREQRAQASGGQGGGTASRDHGGRLGDDVPPPSGGGKNRPVAVVVFHKDVKPINGIFYFRHTAFSQFNGIRLVQSTRADADVGVRQEFPHDVVTLGDPPPDAASRVEVATDVALLTDHESVFSLTDALELSPLVNPDPARFRRAYHVVSSVVAGDVGDLLDLRAGEASWPDDLWAHYTSLPSDPRYLQLARTLQAELRPGFRKNPTALALTIKHHLETTSTYSFNKRHDQAEDPTASFLFSDDRRGYCVHLAHATALLLRALKVPARVSAGYAVPAERLGEGSSLLVKAENAHAWAEIYLRGLGWVPVEVTPERSDVEANPFVERDLQQMLGEMARKQRRVPSPQQQPIQLTRLWNQIAAALPWVLLGLLVLAYACKAYRLAAPWLSRRARGRLAYRAALDRLSAVGLSRAHGETRERFAARVAAVTPSFPPLTDAHLAAALGSRRPLPDHVERQAVQVGREVRLHQAWWRWMLGVLNPVNWLWSR